MKALIERRNELLDKMEGLANTANEEVRALSDEETTEFDNCKKEIEGLDATLKRKEEMRALDGFKPVSPAGKETDDEVDEVRAFVNVLKYNSGFTKSVDEEDVIAVRAMNETVGEDGGLTVPQDIQTKIQELRRSYPDALENYVNIEAVATLSGSRVIEVEADYIPFDKVEEAAIFPEVATPKFEKIPYSVDKFGGQLQLSYELLKDSAENIMGYIQRWAAKKSKATRNQFIIKVLNDEFGKTKKAIKSLDDLKDIFNVEIDPSLRTTSILVTNQDGLNYLDKLKDEDGRYILQPDPVKKTELYLFGKYRVVELNNKTLPTKTNKAPVYCGDLKEGITLFDRETFGLEFTDKGPNWNKDLIDGKARERLDVRAFDKKAIVVGEIDLSVTAPATK